MKKVMSNKEKMFLKQLCGLNSNYFLSALSSSYAEEEKIQFKDEFGVSFKEANEIVNRFLSQLK